jgi:hypothetical protein
MRVQDCTSRRVCMRPPRGSARGAAAPAAAAASGTHAARAQDDGERFEGEFFRGLREGAGRCYYAPHEEGMTVVYTGTFQGGVR